MNTRFKVKNGRSVLQGHHDGQSQRRNGRACGAFACSSLLLFAACSGDLGPSDFEEPAASPPVDMPAPTDDPVVQPPVVPPEPPENGWKPPKLGDSQKYSPIRRLTINEYERTVKNAFGVTELEVPRLPEDEDNGILRAPEAKPLADYDSYVEAAMAVGAQLAPAVAATCDWQADLNTCTQGIATKLETLYRTPVGAEDLDVISEVIQAAFDRDLDQEIAVSQGIARALLDSRFIYQIEQGNEQVTPTDGVGLTGFETAARLSYFLLDAPPDTQLLEAARTNALDTPEARQAELDRIFTAEAAEESIWRFARNWLRLANNTEISTSLQESMLEETRLLVKHILVDEKAPFSDLLSAKYSFINAELAEHYGVPAPATDWEMYQFPAESLRQGVLTHASFLSANGDHEKRDVSWIFRGKVLYEHLFCGHLSAPPDPTLIEKPVEDRTKDAQCAGCHSILDPAGKLFDMFDADGKRVTDGAVPGPVLLHSDIDADYANFAEFADAVKMSQAMTHCFTRVWLRDALGREPSSKDQASFDAAWEAFRNTGSVREMLSAIVAQPSFTTFYPRPSDMVCQ